MNLPELSVQILYGRVAWALVLTALLCGCMPDGWRRARAAPVLALLASLACNALPGELAPSYWLALAFQLPSALVAALCAMQLLMLWQGQRVHALLPPALAAPVAVLASVLYLDAMGLLALGWYSRGFGPVGAPLVAVVLAIGSALAAARGWLRPYALALLAALCVFAVLRLPTGNLWDALLDPFLAAWALASVGVTLWRRRVRTI